MLPRKRMAEIIERGNRKRIETYGYGPYGVRCPECGEFQPAQEGDGPEILDMNPVGSHRPDAGDLQSLLLSRSEPGPGGRLRAGMPPVSPPAPGH